MSTKLRSAISIWARFRPRHTTLISGASVSIVRFSDSAAPLHRKTWEPRKNADRLKSSNQLKFEMELLFYQTRIRQREVDHFIEENIKFFDYQSLSELMRLSVKASKSARYRLLAAHLSKIATKLQLLREENWSFKEISFLIYGLQGMDQDHQGALEIIEIMTKIATRIMKRISPNEQGISMILLGLQDMSHDKEEVRKLLLVVASMINRCDDKFINQTVGNSFYSLKRMESDCVEVRTVLTALLPKVIECGSVLSSQHVGNAFYGLQGMHSDCNEVCAILTALVVKIKTCRENFTAQEISNAIYGMQCMNSNRIEVRAVLAALTSKVNCCTEIFYAQHISNILYGLQGMSSDCPEVRDILAALVPKFRDSKDIFVDQTVGNALYGLQGMNSDFSEVGPILSALVPKVYGCTHRMGVRDIGNSLYGLQGVGRELQSTLLFDYLYRQIDQLIFETVDFRELPTNDLFYLCQILTLGLPEIKTALKGKYPLWEQVYVLANNVLIARRDADDPFFTHGKMRSPNEERIRNVATKLFQNSRILLSFNGYLFGLFETDLVLKIPPSSPTADDSFFINIEMEGLYHKHQRRERFRMLRDKYLTSKGVVVERIELLTLRRMDEGDLMKWLLSRVTEATSAFRKSEA